RIIPTPPPQVGAPPIMISGIGPRLMTSFFNVEKVKLVVHLNLSKSTFHEFIESSNPVFLISPTLESRVLNPVELGTGRFNNISFVFLENKSILPPNRLFQI